MDWGIFARFIIRLSEAIIGLGLLFSHFAFATGVSDEKKSVSDQLVGEDELQDELELGDDDFPDLVHADGTGEFFDELEFLQESAMVEVSARHQQQIGMSPSAITVITREDVDTLGAIRITDLLRLVPGLDVVYITPSITSVSGRLNWGYANTNFMQLIDGRETNLELFGQPLWEVSPIFIEEIERIEIIRGPGSALYGANALSGVVAITTRPTRDDTSGWALLQAGEGDHLTSGARISRRFGDFGLSLSGGFDQAGGLLDLSQRTKQIGRTRVVADYRISDTSRLVLDLGLAAGQGSLLTGFGQSRVDVSFRPVHLSYQSEDLELQLTWTSFYIISAFEEFLSYAGLHLADLATTRFDADILDSRVQWTVPESWDWLLVILGGRVRASNLRSDRALDAETFTDPLSSRYHQEGVDDWELRAGAYLHTEISPVDWLTFTGGTRLDYSSVTGVFLSPRLAAVAQPWQGQFFRLGIARAFRMPAHFESSLHYPVDFPEGSIFSTEDQQNSFREFMTRVLGNPDLNDEELTALEAGYRGEFLDGRLAVSLDLFLNWHTNQIYLFTDMQLDINGLPDLQASTARFANLSEYDQRIFGQELTVRYSPAREVSLLAAWAYREVFFLDDGRSSPNSPRHQIILGGRLRTGAGFLGSLYLQARGDFTDQMVTSPHGILAPWEVQHLDSYFLVLARLGWQFKTQAGFDLEAGLRMFLPVSPFSEPHFRYQEKGGGEDVFGKHYSADGLKRVITLYLQGSF